MAKGSKDWLFDQDITLANHHDLAVDIHHVFPKAWCESHHIDGLRRESIANKTAISAATNRAIGGRAPSRYVEQLITKANADRSAIAARITGHQIDFDALASDDFDAYFDARRAALLGLIGDAMGKAISDVPSAGEPSPLDYDLDDDELSDDDEPAVV
jgi:hypothetical protein